MIYTAKIMPVFAILFIFVILIFIGSMFGAGKYPIDLERQKHLANANPRTFIHTKADMCKTSLQKIEYVIEELHQKMGILFEHNDDRIDIENLMFRISLQ